MTEKTEKIIYSLVGVAGLILYGYLILIADISADYKKFTVIVAALGLLYPLISLTNNEFIIGKKWRAIGVGVLGFCVILIAGYVSKVDTSDGLIIDFFKAISSENYRIFFLIVLIIANVVPLISRSLSVWVSSFSIGLIAPIALVTFIILVIVVIIITSIDSSSKSGGSTSSSWSDIFKPSESANTPAPQTTNNFKQENRYTPIASFRIEWRHNGQPLTNNAILNLPYDSRVEDFVRELKRMHGGDIKILSYRRGNDPEVVFEHW